MYIGAPRDSFDLDSPAWKDMTGPQGTRMAGNGRGNLWERTKQRFPNPTHLYCFLAFLVLCFGLGLWEVTIVGSKWARARSKVTMVTEIADLTSLSPAISVCSYFTHPESQLMAIMASRPLSDLRDGVVEVNLDPRYTNFDAVAEAIAPSIFTPRAAWEKRLNIELHRSNAARASRLKQRRDWTGTRLTRSCLVMNFDSLFASVRSEDGDDDTAVFYLYLITVQLASAELCEVRITASFYMNLMMQEVNSTLPFNVKGARHPQLLFSMFNRSTVADEVGPTAADTAQRFTEETFTSESTSLGGNAQYDIDYVKSIRQELGSPSRPVYDISSTFFSPVSLSDPASFLSTAFNSPTFHPSNTSAYITTAILSPRTFLQTTYVETQSYDLSTFVGDMGGLLGLFFSAFALLFPTTELFARYLRLGSLCPRHECCRIHAVQRTPSSVSLSEPLNPPSALQM